MSHSSSIVDQMILLVLIAFLLCLMVSADVPEQMANVAYTTDSGVVSDILKNLSQVVAH